MAQGGLTDVLQGLVTEVRALTLEGPRARFGLAAAVAVPLAVVIALALQFDYPFWAGFYCLIVLKSAVGATVEDAVRRTFGTVFGAFLGFVLGAGFAASHLLTHLGLFLVVTICVYKQLTGERPVFWLVIGLTMVVVTFDSLLTPQDAIVVAISRCLEITLGVAVGSLVELFMFPDEPSPGPPAPMAPADARFTAVVAGLSMAVIPAIWFPFQLQGMSGAGFTSLLLPDPKEPIERFRALLVVTGTVIGGIVGLVAARLQGGDLLPAIVFMAAAMFVFGQIQLGGSRVALAGTFMGTGYIVINIQGAVPTTDTSPLTWFIVSAALGALVVVAVTKLLSLVMPHGIPPAAQAKKGG